ncbi:MAG: serine hydrolase domain-containing protein [Candidatus Dormibacteria bacterium]
MQAVVVEREGEVVWERYYGGLEMDLRLDGGPELGGKPYRTSEGPEDLHCLKSCTKSFVSALVGIALDKGLIPGLDSTLGELLPQVTEAHSEKAAITIGDLLRMRSGLEWVENGEITLRYLLSGDMLGFTLHEQRVVAPPGERWEYSTADTHLLAACLTSVSGMSPLDFLEVELLRPLGITKCRWTADRTGLNLGGSELFLSPRDMTKLGRLYLQEGRWNGEQLVPAWFVRLSTAGQPGVDARVIAGRYNGALPPGFAWPEKVPQYSVGYGMQWWRSHLADRDRFTAQGFGGQLIVAVEEFDAVIAINCTVNMPTAAEAGAMSDEQLALRLVGDRYLADRVLVPALLGT